METSIPSTLPTEPSPSDAISTKMNTQASAEEHSPRDVRVAVLGNVDSGKSTLVGVLTRCVLDTNGRTSSIAQELMGFDAEGKQVVPQLHGKNANSWSEISEKSSTCVTLLDLCGHEKYLRTTLFGLAGMAPDFAIVVVGANSGVLRITKEHLGVALALQVPIVIVVTKIDFAPEEVRTETIRMLQRILKSPAANKLSVLVRNPADAITVAQSFYSGRVAPNFAVSSVSGVGLDALRTFLANSRRRTTAHLGSPQCPLRFSIDGVYEKRGVGTVVAGTVLSGHLKLNQQVLLGPDGRGEFRPVLIKSVHHRRVPAETALPGDGVSCSIKAVPGGSSKKWPDLRRDTVRKGQHLVELPCAATYTAALEVSILHHATTISQGYQAVMHCGVTRQVVKVLHILDPDSLPPPSAPQPPPAAGADPVLDVSNGAADFLAAIKTVGDAGASRVQSLSTSSVVQWPQLRSGERAILIVQFVYRPELLHLDTPLLLREGKTRAVGRVVGINLPGFTHLAAGEGKAVRGKVKKEEETEARAVAGAAKTSTSPPVSAGVK